MNQKKLKELYHNQDYQYNIGKTKNNKYFIYEIERQRCGNGDIDYQIWYIDDKRDFNGFVYHVMTKKSRTEFDTKAEAKNLKRYMNSRTIKGKYE